MNCNIRRDVRVCFTKLRLSSHKFLVERARWLKVKVPYTQRTCTLCHSNDIEDEYHVTLVCEYFRDVRKKFIKPFYYQRPNMMKFLDLMTSVSKKDRFRLTLFLKVVFNPIRSGGGGALKVPPPPIFCPHAFNFGATLLCVGDSC